MLAVGRLVKRIKQLVIELNLIDGHDVALLAPLEPKSGLKNLNRVLDVALLGREIDAFGHDEHVHHEPVLAEPFFQLSPFKTATLSFAILIVLTLGHIARLKLKNIVGI